MPDRADKQQVGALGFTRSPSEDDPRRDPRLLASIARVAPGTELRQGIDDIIRSHEGALIVIGDPEALSFLYSGGMRLDINFTASSSTSWRRWTARSSSRTTSRSSRTRTSS